MAQLVPPTTTVRGSYLAGETEAAIQEGLPTDWLQEAAADFADFVERRRAIRELWGVPVTEPPNPAQTAGVPISLRRVRAGEAMVIPSPPCGYSPWMRVEVQAVHQVTDELVGAAGRLLPQLSRSAAPLDAEGLARITSHQAITLFVARVDGVIVGMLTLVTFPLPSGLRTRIEDVVVDQDARGHGVGTALTMAAIDLAQRQGARNIDLTSRSSRVAANRLYQQLGFQLRDSNVYRYQPRLPAS